jgi:hypothetical protein
VMGSSFRDGPKDQTRKVEVALLMSTFRVRATRAPE